MFLRKNLFPKFEKRYKDSNFQKVNFIIFITSENVRTSLILLNLFRNRNLLFSIILFICEIFS